MDRRFKDHSGEKYGMLTVIERTDQKCGSGYMWRCKCDCGNYKLALIANMKEGRTISCGCQHTNDITGKRYGRLTVVKRWESLPSGHSKWLCVCDCGKTKIVEDSNLKHSDKISCGCWRKELYKENAKYRGESHNTLYIIWASMIRRCTNPKEQNYKYYGARGIKVCNEWVEDKNGYFTFKNWALLNGWEEGLSIERVNVNGDYCPENCIWIPFSEQCKNKRTTHWITYKGKTMCLTDWANEYNINRYTLYCRLYRSGWSIDKALETPVKH